MAYKIFVTLYTDAGNIIKTHEVVSFGDGTAEHMAVAATDIIAVKVQALAKDAMGKAKAMRKPPN